MTAGLQVFKPDGSIAFDSTMRVGRFLGIVQPPLGQSVYYDDRLADGSIPFAFAWPTGTYPATGMMGRAMTRPAV